MRAGSWERDHVLVTWKMRGQELSMTASEMQLLPSVEYQDTVSLSGARVIARAREYAEAGRASNICDPPLKIQLTFPRMPAEFYHFMRSTRTFHRAFSLEIRSLDALDREMCWTDDAVHYYGSVGGWQPGSVVLFVNNVDTPLAGFAEVNHPWGIVRFSEARQPSDIVEVRYVWAPRVVNVEGVEPTFRAGLRRVEAEVKITLMEIRPSNLTANNWV